MKGKNIFTTEEVNYLKKLIELRINADKYEQKKIRAEMRKIGFFGQDDFGIYNLQLEDFDSLVAQGKIKIKNRQE